jgi:hypothetical protein
VLKGAEGAEEPTIDHLHLVLICEVRIISAF